MIFSGSYGTFYFSLEVEGALTSCFKEPMRDRSFVADFGSFDSEDKAVEKVESLKKEILTPKAHSAKAFLTLSILQTGSFDSIKLASKLLNLDNPGMLHLSFRRPRKMDSQVKPPNHTPITSAFKELPTKMISAMVFVGYWIKPKQALPPSRVKS